MQQNKPLSAAQRGYDSRWMAYRMVYLREHPLCAMHHKRGQRVPATVVDHIQPHRLGQALNSGDPEAITKARKLFWDPSNHQSLCKPCHDSHKQRYEKTGRVVGCDANGCPIDDKHHWNQRVSV